MCQADITAGPNFPVNQANSNLRGAFTYVLFMRVWPTMDTLEYPKIDCVIIISLLK